MKSSLSLQEKIGLVFVLAGVLAGVSVLAASSGKQASRRVVTRIDGKSRITVSQINGAMCELPQVTSQAASQMTSGKAVSVPVNPVTMLLAMQQAAERPAAAVGAQAASAGRATGPTAAQKAAVAARKPIRRIHDDYPQ